MPDTPLLMYQRRRAEAARDAARQPPAEPAAPGPRYAEARAMVREALTFPDALEAVWGQLKAEAEADLIADFPARGAWLHGFFDAIIDSMEEVLAWTRRQGATLGRTIPRTEELAAAVAEAKRFREAVLANWPDPERDLGDARPTLGTLGAGERCQELFLLEFLRMAVGAVPVLGPVCGGLSAALEGRWDDVPGHVLSW